MPRPHNSRLDELSALAQLYAGLQAPQMRAQEDQRQNSLGILGLLMQNQQQQAQAEHQQKSLDAASGQFWGGTLPAQYADQAARHQEAEANRQAELTNAQAMQTLQMQRNNEASGEFWKGTLPAQYAEQKMKQDELAAQTKIAQGQLDESKRFHDASLAGNIFENITKSSGAIPADQLLQLAGITDPRFAAAGKQMQQDAMNKRARGLAPSINSMPSEALAGMDPELVAAARGFAGQNSGQAVPMPNGQVPASRQALDLLKLPANAVAWTANQGLNALDVFDLLPNMISQATTGKDVLSYTKKIPYYK